MKKRVALVILLTLIISEVSLRTNAVTEAQSSDFLAEQRYVVQHMTTDDNENVVSPDYHGRYFNVDNHIRYTPGKPLVYNETIYIFGSSSAFGYSVSDEHTLASELQRYFKNIRVVNMASIGYGVVQQLNRLKSLKLQPGDMVIFYDGVGDSITAYDRGYAKLPIWCREASDRLHHLALVRTFVEPCQSAIQIEARDYSIPDDVYRVLEANACPMYPWREKVIAQSMLQFKQVSLDLRHALPPEDFVDCYHFNAQGSAKVARNIYDAISIY